jgi:hypothetical protein
MGMNNRTLLHIFGACTAFAAALFVSPALASAATLSLSPTTGSHAVGDTFDVTINVDTSSVATNGTDAYVRFDSTVLEVVDANTGTEGVQITPGSIYSQTSYNLVESGKISFSGSKSSGSAGYSGSGVLATIKFRALTVATNSAVTIDFTSGSTTDSNVINTSSQDVLTAVTSAAYTVTEAGSGTDTDTDTDTDGANGNSGTDGTGGSGDVAGTGMDLTGSLALTLIALIGAGYFFTRKPTHHRR